MKRFKLIIIDARRWFDRPNGNTYHAVTVTVKHARRPDTVLQSGMHYGYGEQYYQTAHALLQKAGYFADTGTHRDYSDFLDHMRNNRSMYHVTVADVNRKKDL